MPSVVVTDIERTGVPVVRGGGVQGVGPGRAR